MPNNYQYGKGVTLSILIIADAPRQTGKTTFLQSWMHRLNREGEVVACYVSVERCQEFPRAEEAIPAVCSAIQEYADAYLGSALVPSRQEGDPASLLSQTLKAWAALTVPKRDAGSPGKNGSTGSCEAQTGEMWW